MNFLEKLSSLAYGSLINLKRHNFLVKRIGFEESLNKLSYRGAARVGELCSHAVNRWCRGQKVISVLGFLKSLIWLILQAFKSSIIKDEQCLYLKPNNEERVNRLFQPLEMES